MDEAAQAQRLTDIEAIKQLKARYFRLLDQKQWADWALVFTTDVHMVVPEGEVDIRGRDESVASVSAALEGVVTVHHGHMPEIEITSADTARGTWAMYDDLEFPGSDGGPSLRMQGFGHYTEEYAREDGEWRIASLHLTRLRVDFT